MRLFILFFLPSLLSGAALAQTAENIPTPLTTSVPLAAPEPMPAPVKPSGMEMKITHGVTYITGGRNASEISKLKELQNEFNVQLILSGKNNEYFDNITLSIRDLGKFELVKQPDAGPYFFAYMRPGTYFFEAINNNDGSSHKLKIVVPKKGTVKKTLFVVK